jgi:hypothetical protein
VVSATVYSSYLLHVGAQIAAAKSTMSLYTDREQSQCSIANCIACTVMLNSQNSAHKLASVATVARCSAMSAHCQCCNRIQFTLLCDIALV